MHDRHSSIADQPCIAVCMVGAQRLDAAAQRHHLPNPPLGTAPAPVIHAGAAAHLSAAELAVCSAAGIDPEAFAAAKASDSRPSPAPPQLSVDEMAICSATGIDPRAFVAAKVGASSAHPVAELSADEMAICRATGIDPKAFAAARLAA